MAALTMPALVVNYQKQQTVTRLKKAFSVLSQAFKLSEVENGDAAGWAELGAESLAKNTEFHEKYVFPYLKTVKICTTNYKDCGWGGKRVSLNGMALQMIDGTSVAAILADGTSIVFRLTTSNVTSTAYYDVIYIDVNGDKSPNTVGKDVFRLGLNGDSGEVTLSGCGDTNPNITDYRDFLITGYPTGNVIPRGCNTNQTGEYCACLIQYDGWEIKEDYPY